jgi:hypothetical protein
MDVSIVILNYKQRGLVKQCIKGIVSSQPQLEYEIIVVDNASNDGTLEMVETVFTPPEEHQLTLPVAPSMKIPPIITIQAERNGGFAIGNNLGIAKARGTYIMVINPDIAVVPGSIEAMHLFMEQHSDIGILGPKLINPDGSVQHSCRRYPNFFTPLYRRTFFGHLPFARRSLDYYLMVDFDHVTSTDVDWLFGACLFIRTSVVEKVGAFDERFFMYFEDLDLCRRVWQAGYRVTYLVTITMVHYHQRLSAERSGLLGLLSHGGRIHVASGIKYFAKYLGVPLPKRHTGQNVSI